MVQMAMVVLGLREFEEGMRCRAGAGIGKSKKKLGYKQPTTIYVSMIFLDPATYRNF